MAEAVPVTAHVVVVVPFIAWGPLVERCLVACLQLDGEDFVVCLVPNDVAAVPAAWATQPRVTVIGSGVDSISRKRNLAIAAHPAAEFFACIDSDAWPEPGWLRNALRVFAGDADVWLVGGPNLSPPGLSADRQMVADALLSVLVSGPKTYTKQVGGSRDAVDLPSCNLLMRRRAVEAIGGFDESVEVGEDSVLCQAVIACGKTIRFSPDVRVFHEPRSFLLPFVKQRIVSGYGIPPVLWRCYRSMRAPAIAAELLPAAALVYLAFGWGGGWILAALGTVWLVVLAAYGGLVAFETLRVTSHSSPWWRTAIAILIGNLAPGVGILYRCAGLRLPVGRFYRNDERWPLSPVVAVDTGHADAVSRRRRVPSAVTTDL